MKIFLTLIWFSQALASGQAVGTVKVYETLEECEKRLKWEMAAPKDAPVAGFCGDIVGTTIKKIP